MHRFFASLLRLKTDTRAVTALEFAFIAGVIAVVMMVGATSLGTSLSARFVSVAASV